MNPEFVEGQAPAAETTSAATEARQAWMAVLATADSDALKSIWNTLGDADRPAVDMLREPETGLVMVRGRAGGTGAAFNMGEMTVTRCAVRAADGTVGVSYLAGRDKTHARIAATVDAMLQSEALAKMARDTILAPLEAAQAKAADEQARKTEATRVNFFTMVRSREEK